MKKTLVSLALALAAPTACLALTTTAAEASVPYYSSCAKLTARFPHGVAKSAAAAQRQVNQGYGRPASGDFAQKVYWKNESRLDRDNDGTACER